MRGWHVALVPDALINPAEALRTSLPDVLQVLEERKYGVLQLPPPGTHGPLLAVIADQVAEYAHHGYAVVAIGVRGEPGTGSTGAGSRPCCDTAASRCRPAISSVRRLPARPRGSGSQNSSPTTTCPRISNAAGACSGPLTLRARGG